MLAKNMVLTVGFLCHADEPGRWLFRCSVQDHNTAGMKGVLAVIPRNGQLNATEPVMS